MSLNPPSISGAEVAGMVVKPGSAWVSARLSERTIANQAYSSDPKYKKYIQQVEKCLNHFNNVHEWADCIAFLKQLLQTFESYTQFKEIPRKLIVAKRLAQCLNPALPTGVHQRALAVYTHILTVLGIEGLKRDLTIWSSGLFPFFEYAATSVKPTLLTLYQTHYLPLQNALRPIMKSFILALLPGLEEETGEFFEKVLSLLDRLAGCVSMSFFFQNIWLVMLTMPSARGTALNFLARRLPQLNADEDIAEIVGKDMGLMIRAFGAALEDENLLVRRGALDILLQSLKVNSYAISKAQGDDRTILMRAATGVVLRRDLSLNRRLYTWLLGHEERSDLQISYLKENALDLLSATLKAEMISPSVEYAESRPFKIFISLLDKWEIGAPLTDVLIYDALRAAKALIENPKPGGEDLTMTANTLYDAVEPQILWEHLLKTIFDEIRGDGSRIEALQLTQFILKAFSHDEETQTIYLPVAFSATLELVEVELTRHPQKLWSRSTAETWKLLDVITSYLPDNGLSEHPEIAHEDLDGNPGSLKLARTFLKIPIPETTTHPMADSASTPLIACTRRLFSITTLIVHTASAHPEKASASREGLGITLMLLGSMTRRIASPTTIPWDPSYWLNSLLTYLRQETVTFTTVDKIITVLTTLHRNGNLQPRLSIDERPIISVLINKLLKYLYRDYTQYHVRAVNLIWSLDASSSAPHVESILAQSMNVTDLPELTIAYEAFGALWRLSEDSLMPGFRFRVPMMMVLDSLKSQNPSLRRVGETWMRCSLKSYIRILDPIIYDLVDPTIVRVPTTFKVRGRELQGFLYVQPFDQRLINHFLETLLSIVNFGGQGFAKSARALLIKRSQYPGLVQRVRNSGLVENDSDYLAVLVEILLRLLRTEPATKWLPSMQSLNSVIQSNAIELLQVLVSRSEIDKLVVDTIEATTIGKLYFSIHVGRLDLQNKWLHLLHSVISISTANLEATINEVKAEERVPESGVVQDKAPEIALRYPVNPLLVQVLMDGISIRTNKPVLQHWLDFILMAIPQFQPALQAVVAPLNDCLCRQTLSALSDVLKVANQHPNASEDYVSTVTDAELIMLLNGLERLILLSLAYTSEPDSTDDESVTIEKSTSEGSSLLGYVSNVFSSESTQTGQADQLTSRSPGYRSLDEGIRVLYSVWASLVWRPSVIWSPKDETLALIYNRTRLRCRRVLEHLFRVQGAEVFESIVDWWNREATLSTSAPDAAFELLDILVANAQNAVHMICDSISSRISGTSERTRKQAINPNLTDSILFTFLEQYFRRLEGPIAIQVWSRFVQLLKEIIGTTRDFKAHNFSALKCLAVLAEKVTQTSAIEDKRIRKELQDNYGKLLDICVAYVGKATDQSSWIRRTTKEAGIMNGRDSPAPRNTEEKVDTPLATEPGPIPKVGSLETISQINSFVESSALPNLRKILSENDKIINACNNIVYYIVNPAMRGKARPMDVGETVINILQEIAHIPAALKAWRTPIVELLADNRLFNCTPAQATQWKPIVKALYDTDKTAFPDLLGRISNTASANIFTNREYEMLLRSLNLRRLSYVIFVGEKNHFLTQLPSVQERLVDTLRSVPSPIVQSEVFLCIRILLCRLSPHNLTSFWPVVLTEMYRVLEQTMITLPSDGSEDLQLVLGACKCLDLLLTLQTEEFQVHQWIFITDTVDAVYRPDDWFPEAMMDQLAEIAGTLPVSSNSIDSLPRPEDQRPIRKPLLGNVRHIESIRDLVPFFSSISLASYENVYASGGNVDWEAVEKSIVDDMFDGQ